LLGVLWPCLLDGVEESAEQLLVGVARCQMGAHSVSALPDAGAYLEELEPQGVHLGRGQLGSIHA